MFPLILTALHWDCNGGVLTALHRDYHWGGWGTIIPIKDCKSKGEHPNPEPLARDRLLKKKGGPHDAERRRAETKFGLEFRFL